MANLEDRVAIVTGAGQGLGRALVDVLLAYNVKKIYATARNVTSLRHFIDRRVIPTALDITNPVQISTLKQQAGDVNLLINNAGINTRASVLTGSFNDVKREMDTNFYGTLEMIRAFSPVIEANGGGNVVNIISICAFASMPGLSGYSASKAALFSATQAIRTDLKPKNIQVHAVFPGPIDTDMNKGLDIEMATPQSVAEAILDGVLNEAEDIFPDTGGQQVGRDWLDNPKKLERQFSQY